MQLNIIFYKTFIICLTHNCIASQWEARMFGFWFIAGCKICICFCLRGSSFNNFRCWYVSYIADSPLYPLDLCLLSFRWPPKFGWFFQSNYLSFTGYFERVSTASQCQKIQNHHHHRYYGFFRRLFGVKNVATWSLLVVEATGDWKVGWVEGGVSW